jgi:hypothetical protein
MKLLLAAVLYHLVVMPTSAPSGMKTSDNKDLFKPFDVAEETFDTEEACMVFAKATIKAHLAMHGLPPDTQANFFCSNQ